jgi:hypothetical protein
LAKLVKDDEKEEDKPAGQTTWAPPTVSCCCEAPATPAKRHQQPSTHKINAKTQQTWSKSFHSELSAFIAGVMSGRNTTSMLACTTKLCSNKSLYGKFIR